MKDDILLVYTRNKNILQTKRGLRAFTNNSNYPKAKAYYFKHCEILRKGKVAKKQHYSRLVAKSNNKIKTTWNIIKRQEIYI